MSSKIINISLDKELLKKVDNAAKAIYCSRSDYIRAALVEQLKSHGQIITAPPQPIQEPSIDPLLEDEEVVKELQKILDEDSRAKKHWVINI